jgi:urease accessory protein
MAEELPLLTSRLQTAGRVDGEAALTFEERCRARLRIRLDDGREAGILLPRGETLRDGDLLSADNGLVVRIRAARERLSTAVCDAPLLLARACYHLGNRHVALQIEQGRLCWLHDHVLDDMVRGLGLDVGVAEAIFEPEPGAYGGHHRGHHRGHHHDHAHDDDSGHGD